MKLLVVIPYRDRESHLKEFIPYITRTLQNQAIESKVVVVEQSAEKLFNRGLLFNIGFKEYHKNYDYIITHDVDMICQNIDYSYNNNPTVLLSSRTRTKWLPSNCFGGIVLFPNDKFKIVNGFSNKYWGWGAEDDDIRTRCNIAGFKIERRNAICTDLESVSNDVKRNQNPHYNSNVKIWKDFMNSTDSIRIMMADGINSCEKLYTVESQTQYEYYDLIKVKV